MEGERAHALLHDAGVLPLPCVRPVIFIKNLAHRVDAAALRAVKNDGREKIKAAKVIGITSNTTIDAR